MVDWFRRNRNGFQTKEKKEIPDVWKKCENESCGEVLFKKELTKNYNVCPKCGYHFRISSQEYIKYLVDENSFEETIPQIHPVDHLKFVAKKSYADQLKQAREKTNLLDAIRAGQAKINNIPVAFAIMDFSFIGGSMGSVVGERTARTIDLAIKEKMPLIIVTSSGGARMQEAAFSLMQMAKTSSKLTLLSEARIPYIAVLTHPTTGGVTASFAMLGDIILAEPGALIGFAGPRVIEQAVGKALPKGFQTAEFLLEHGFVDRVVNRGKMKSTIFELLNFFSN